MKNQYVLLTQLMAVVCAFGVTGITRSAQESSEQETPGQTTSYIGNLAQEFATEYDAYRNKGLLGKAGHIAVTSLWLHENRQWLMGAAAIAGNSNDSRLAHYAAQKFVTALDPLIHDGPMRQKLDAAKAYLWLHNHKQELIEAAAGNADFPHELAEECVTVLSPLVPKEVLDKNLDKAKTYFWVRKHKNAIICAVSVGVVASLAAAFGAGYYLGSDRTSKTA